MRRALAALTGIVAGTTLLISLKSAPGASRLPDQVVADQQAALRSARPAPSAGPSDVDTPAAGPTASDDPLPSADPGRSQDPVDTPSAGPRAPASTHATRPTTKPSAGPGGSSTMVIGDSAFTEFGYVTVAITVSGGRIADVVTVEMPGDEPRSVSLSDRAAPLLRQRALTAQSAHIDTVSGATWTSDAYRQSLQSAIDKAGLG
jgi:uncharacterized protein with FMN-binding domain